MGYVLVLNSGIKRMYRDMQAMSLDPPEYSEPDKTTVKLVLKNNYSERFARK